MRTSKRDRTDDDAGRAGGDTDTDHIARAGDHAVEEVMPAGDDATEKTGAFATEQRFERLLGEDDEDHRHGCPIRR